MKNTAISNLKLSDVVKVTARDVKTSFSALELSFADGVTKEAQAETENAVGAFASVLSTVDKAYFKMAVLAGTVNDKELFRNLVNPETEKPFTSFKEMCLSPSFARYMVNEKGAVLSYPFINQLASVGKYFYLPSVNGDANYDVFKDMSVSALLPFIPYGGTDVMPMLLSAFNGADGESPKYDAAKMTVKQARALAKRVENRENILADETATEAAPESNAESGASTESESKPESASKPKQARKSGRGRKSALESKTESKPEPTTPTPTKADYFVISIWTNDGRAPIEFLPQTVEDFKMSARNVGETYKNVLVLNGTKCAFALMFSPVTPEKVDVAAAISDNLQKLYKLRNEFAPITTEATTEAAPESTTEGAPESTTEAAPESTTEGAPESTTEAAPESTTEGAPESTTEAAPESTTEG